MRLRFYNTLTARVEDFTPLEGNRVRIYTCGPTVYNYAHIGNFRTFVFQDVLRRFLKYRGYDVYQVLNLTDVDDRTIANAKAAGLPLRDYTAPFIEAYQVDRQLLNLEMPEVFVRATDHIDDMVRLIQALEGRGLAYASDGSVYFRVQNISDYGKLSRINFAGNRPGARVDADEYDKDDARDFVLWKGAREGEPFWETPLGPGRPGWHIECSAMSMKYLGETFDIHSGGSDLVFPHHENEIAQSEGATGKPFVHFWLHAEHLVVNGEKMSKSRGNFFTLRDLIAKGHRPSAIRYLLASVPYRRPLNFTFEGLHQADQSLARLRNFRSRLTMEKFASGENPELQARAEAARRAFEEALDDNLNTAEALAAIFDLVRDANTAMDRGEFREDIRPAFLDVLERWDRIFAVLEDNDYTKLKQLGFVEEVFPDQYQTQVSQPVGGSPSRRVALQSSGETALPYTTPVLQETLSDEEMEKRIFERETARRRGDFARADQIRDELVKAGVILEDTKAGTRWRRK